MVKEKIKVYLEIQERNSWDEEVQESIIDIFTIKIPRKNSIGYEVNDEVLEKIKVKLAEENDIESIEENLRDIKIQCMEYDPINIYNLEDIYETKKFIENKVKAKMQEVYIFEYELNIAVSTLYHC